MSNKTILQENNSKLDELSSLINIMCEIAANLPDTGNGNNDTAYELYELTTLASNKATLQECNTKFDDLLLLTEAIREKVVNLTEGGNEEEQLTPGLYETGIETLIKSWDTLVTDGDISLSGTTITSGKSASLAGDLYIPDSVTSIRSSAFSGCTGLTSVTIPDSVETIGDSAFWKCSGLTDMIINCSTIGAYAFFGCAGLTSVTIGNRVKSIGKYAFDATGLTQATFKNTTEWKTGVYYVWSSDLSDTSTAATCLKTTYVGYEWTRS